jgi:hypothetical protein
MGSGVNLDMKATNFHGDHTPKTRPWAIAKNMPDRIKRVSKMLGYCLYLGDQNGWWGLVTVLRARLTRVERVSIAFVALKSLDRDDALLTAEAALGGAGQPIAPLFNYMDEATFWADMAEPDELDAYCLASFKSMAPGRQAAFLEYVQGRRAA